VIGQSEIFLSNGFDGFISKPIDIRQLNSVLVKFIRDKQPPEVLEAVRQQAEDRAEGAIAPSEAHKQGQAGATSLNPASIAKNKRFTDAFVRDAAKSLAALEDIQTRRNAYSEDDIKTYVIHVHGMKSALASIGENELSALALELEIAGRKEDTSVMASETERFLEELKQTVKRLSTTEPDA
jgi:HPt (histidine-containing phosphotransfer) domain-containing protein